MCIFSEFEDKASRMHTVHTNNEHFGQTRQQVDGDAICPFMGFAFLRVRETTTRKQETIMRNTLRELKSVPEEETPTQTASIQLLPAERSIFQ